MQCIWTKVLFTYFICFSLVNCAIFSPSPNSSTLSRKISSSDPWIPEEVYQLPPQMQNLPLSIKIWYVLETNYLSRRVNVLKISAPANYEQNPFYSPEAQNVFAVKGVWLNEAELKVFSESKIPTDFKNMWTRKKGGKTQYLFLIHPESEDLYAELIKNHSYKEEFLAASTASSRSLLMWKPGREDQPFVAKLSLNKKIGNVKRVVSGKEAASSVGISMALEEVEGLPKEIHFMREPLALVPQGMETGGLIFRLFPKQMLDPERAFMPLFAYYSDQKQELLLNMILKTGEPPLEFIRSRVIRPFIHIWVELALNHRIVSEDHAQNVLQEVTKGIPGDDFIFRDFGGFNIDFAARKAAQLPVPEALPTFSGNLVQDYHQKSHGDLIDKSLRIFFTGGFLDIVQKEYEGWRAKGLFAEAVAPAVDLEDILLEELSLKLTKVTGKKVTIGARYFGLEKTAQAHSPRRPSGNRSCRDLFR